MNSNLKACCRSVFAFLAATLLACVLAASSAFAENQFRSETVRFADLDAGTPAGAQALYGRIHEAVRHVCLEPDPRNTRTCAVLAERRAVEHLNLPLLTAYYRLTPDYQESAQAGRRR